jgi:POT family proton-dependent oligopeptide transporter
MSAPDKKDNFVPPPAGSFLGHPNALWNLFGTEFWERFMYYGMRAMLAVHVAAQFFSHLGADADAEASKTYGGYTAMVYMTGILGGYVADRVLGYQRSIMLGGALMAVGMFMLMTPSLTMFLLGLAVVVVGNGLFKPNISTMVGKLYAPGDPRRDSGFTIFYMGINAGALIAPIICATWIGANYGYEWGFLTAGVGMIFGLMMFQVFKSWLGHVGTTPEGKSGIGPLVQVLVGAAVLVVPVYFLLSQSDLLGYFLIALMVGLVGYFVWSGIQSGQKEQLHRYIAMMILFAANILFWALFEQAGSSLNFLARDYVRMPTILGYTPHFTIFQSVNPVFILLLAPVFAALWPALDKKAINPSIPRKFSFGLAGVAIGFYLLVFAIRNFVGEDGTISWLWLTLMYFIHTMGELCLSPIGLAMVTKLARPQETGLAMGGWFLSIAMANFVAGRIAAIASGGGGGHGEQAAASLTQYGDVFQQLAILGLVIAGIYFLLAPLINKLMHGVK